MTVKQPTPTLTAMPALLVDTSTPSSASPSVDSHPDHPVHARSPSPDRPPVSPITPTVAAAELARPPSPHPKPQPPPTTTARQTPSTFRQQPADLPVSETDNPDAIALRSAISLLQLQRDKAKRDLKALQDLQQQAVQDPHAFVRSLQQQRNDQASAPSDMLTPTLADLADLAARESAHDASPHDADTARKDSVAVETDAPKFPPIPQPQNVVRCPPVNWAKYHIVGEPLDKLHDEQKRYPGSTEPPRTQQGTRAPPHRVAAPYSPFTDGVGVGASQPLRTAPKKTPS